MILSILLLIAAPIDADAVKTARQHYDKARFDDVVKVLRDADLSALEPSVKADALFIWGVSELALQRDALSQKAFVRLFTDNPDFDLPPYTAPKVVTATDRARKQVQVTLRPRVDRSGVVICGDGLPKKAKVKTVFVSATGEKAVMAEFEGPCFKAADPGDANAFYVSASVDDEVRATAGSRNEPLLMTRPVANDHEVKSDEGGTPWYKHWLTWTIVGVVVAGAATATIVYVATRPSASEPGSVRVKVAVP